MAGIVNYEVFVFHNNTWDLIGRYPSERRAAAMEHAKSIEFSQQKPTKVVKETYNLDAQTFNESLVYLSDMPKPQPRQKMIGGAAPNLPKYTGAGKKKTEKRQSFGEAFIMLGLALTISLVGAGALSAGILRVMSSASLIPLEMSSKFTLGTFIFFFLFLSIPLSVRWVNWNVLMGVDEDANEFARIAQSAKSLATSPTYEAEKQNQIKSGQKYSAEADPIVQTIPITQGFARGLFNILDRLLGRKTLAERIEDERQEQLKQKQEAEAKAEEALAEQKSATTQEPTTNEPETEDISDSLPEPVVVPEPEAIEEKKEQEEKPIVLPPELEKYNLRLTALLSIVLKVLQKQNILLNTYARFGIELFLAGACENLCNRKELTKSENQLLLSSLLELLGRSRNLSDLFYQKLDEYMLETPYLPMIETGAKAMEIFSTNPSSPELVSMIQNAMQKWVNPDKKTVPQTGIITVMFTDIVGSTQMTQTYGDRLAQQLIHRHNTIVRQALNTCNGEEIKQTGDGIMASFAWASNAIDAAISIQRAVDLYNRQSPTVPLQVRIGLNSGEPIVENNDLFGLTVQLAARICAQAEMNQIYVSRVVKELAAGKNYHFKDLGLFELKGINEKQPLHQVIWKIEKNKSNHTKIEKPQPSEIKNLDKILPEF